MPNWFGPDPADCGCCADVACGGCSYTRVVFSGITKTGCADCSNLNGTYVFRSASDPWPEDCGFTVPIAGLPGVPAYFGSCNGVQLGSGTCNLGGGNIQAVFTSMTFSIALLPGGGLRGDVILGTGFDTGSGHIAWFSKTGASCADIGGVYSLLSSAPQAGCGDNDYCNTDSATCTVL